MSVFRTASRGLAFILVSIAATNAIGEDLKRHERVGPAMGTTFRVVLYVADDAVATRALDAAFVRIRQLDDIMSDYSDTSELTRLCEKAGGPATAVSEDMFSILQTSSEFAKQSEGAFDVTAGPVIRLWRKARRTKRLPPDPLIVEAKNLVGDDKMILDPAARTVRLMKEGMKLDLGGIAKGYAGDAAIKVIRSFGIERAMVVGGGDIVVGASPPGQPGWKVAVGPSLQPEKDDTPMLVLHNQAVSTSGDSAQFVVIKDRRYSHIVDPRTGRALSERFRVTVVAPTGTQSDALATAVSVLGVEKGLKLIDASAGTAALIARIGTVVDLHPSKNWSNIVKTKTTP